MILERLEPPVLVEGDRDGEGQQFCFRKTPLPVLDLWLAERWPSGADRSYLFVSRGRGTIGLTVHSVCREDDKVRGSVSDTKSGFRGSLGGIDFPDVGGDEILGSF